MFQLNIHRSMPSVSQQDGLEVRLVSVQLKTTGGGDAIADFDGVNEVEELEEAEDVTDDDLPPAMTPSIATAAEARGSRKVEMTNRRIVRQQYIQKTKRGVSRSRRSKQQWSHQPGHNFSFRDADEEHWEFS